MASNPSAVTLKIEFGGGLELLFSNQRSHKVSLPATVPNDNTTAIPVPENEPTKPADITYLIHYLRDHLLKERAELFVENGTVCVSTASFLISDARQTR
jgi:ubiquitin related modifier 1